MSIKLLVVTDHSTHADSNSVYHLSRALQNDPRCEEVWVCSHGIESNHEFFTGNPLGEVFASPVTESFSFDPEGRHFHQSLIRLDKRHVNAILVRMPQPLNAAFLLSLQSIVPPHRIINSPAGIVETATKAFLTELSHLCPEPVLCHSVQQAIDLSRVKEIVLKPLYSYGGRGMVRISRDYCWNANNRYPISDLSTFLSEIQFPMLALKFLKNVTLGDKRTVIVNQKTLGSALRLPAPGSWLCNVAQGGHAIPSEPDEDELAIERHLTPMLFRKGVIMYGFDTLVDDDGHRVLSEINTLSIGGLLPLQEMTERPVMEEAAGLLMDYLTSNV